MSETKWTRGPWVVAKCNGSFNGARILSANNWVASVTRKADKSVDQKVADAYLIAAAPEMYEALEAARGWIAATNNPHDNHCAFICNDGRTACDCPVPVIDAVLKKARGEQ